MPSPPICRQEPGSLSVWFIINPELQLVKMALLLFGV